MTLLNELKDRYATTDLEALFAQVGIDSSHINPDRQQILKEVNLAQWLLESARGESKLAQTANNFSGLKWRSEMADINPKTGKAFATPIEIKVPSEPELTNFCQFEGIEAFIVGYWKFLTRPPYAGLEANTNTPENFLGFLQAKGFSGDPNYVQKVMKLMPEAQTLLLGSEAGQVTVEKFELLRAPEEVVVNQGFKIEGIAHPDFIGKTLAVTIDDRFSAPDVTVEPDGTWEFSFVFNTPGEARRMTISSGDHTIEIIFNVKDSVTVSPASLGTVATSSHPGEATLQLQGSVGVGGLNHPEDLKAIIERLNNLGYTWVDTQNFKRTRGLDDAIRLFQSVIAGSQKISGDGRVDVNNFTHQWLQAKNAPKWVLMPDSNASISFVNGELAETHDHHDFGSHWLHNVILEIATDYHQTYRSAHSHAAPFAINDVSLPHGGNTPDHAGHETGLMCDVFLPRKDGKYGGIDFTKPQYDQGATRALLQSLRKQKLVDKRAIFFNDPVLIREGLCKFATGHHHHIHFAISPPPRA